MEDERHWEEMPNGSLRATLDPDRWYIRTIDKKRIALASVTWILDEGMPKGYGYKKWLASMASFEEAESFYKEAGERGSKVHKGIEQLLKGEKLSHYDMMFGFRESFKIKEWMLLHYFQNWYNTFNPQVIAIETDVWNLDIGYAGTVDLVCDLDEGLILKKEPSGKMVQVYIDWKTSSNIYDSHLMQIAAYAKCRDDVDYAAILRLGSKHKVRYEFKVIDREMIDYYFELFLHCKAIWKHVVGGGEPRYAEVTGEIKL